MSRVTRFVRRHQTVTLLALALCLPVGWYAVRLAIGLYAFHTTFNVRLARSSKTGAYLGEVIGEVKKRDGATGVVYKIKRSDGSVIEESAENIVIFEP